ncbi:uncharacterized protein KY384_003451 [Bacidia gigantensis]|uniref:uncharacterized protein n=1 Tax=Bacidia gigantensis TaxID=2732470 RepID=UPI001D056E3D|nr:uncharacterized protein KY384_003451 [Bacidia gigantensis]KAG8531815.1 hypothetical protein KY384_003451 [Bacidia gigantensis]
MTVSVCVESRRVAQIIAQESNVPTAILEFVFGGTPSLPVVDQSLQSFSEIPVLQADPPSDPAPPGTATASCAKTIGPLSIASVGQLCRSEITAATVKFKVFGLHFPTVRVKKIVASIVQVEVLLNGLGISVEQSVTNDQTHQVTIDEFKSILLLLSVEEPIAELKFASLDGLTGGYGYNSQMRTPSINEVTSHPFLASSQITKPNADVPNIKRNVVLAVDISDDIKIAIFGDVQVTIPTAAKSDSERFAFVELGLLTTLDYEKGSSRLALLSQDGSLGAHLKAWPDFLINYEPFMFTASMGVKVGASYTFRHWGITKKYEVHMGCNLELHSPPVAGKVTVDWWVISFTIHFGNSHQRNDAVDWDGFKASHPEPKVPRQDSKHRSTAYSNNYRR